MEFESVWHDRERRNKKIIHDPTFVLFIWLLFALACDVVFQLLTRHVGGLKSSSASTEMGRGYLERFCNSRRAGRSSTREARESCWSIFLEVITYVIMSATSEQM